MILISKTESFVKIAKINYDIVSQSISSLVTYFKSSSVISDKI
jgi:hypothetical protein